jgi:hypothetical protein
VATLTVLSETDPIAYTAASADGDEFDNADGYSEVELYNRAGIERRVQFVEQRNCTFGEKGSHAAQTVTLSPGDKRRMRHFQIWRYNNADNRVEMTYPDGVAGLMVAPLNRPAL